MSFPNTVPGGSESAGIYVSILVLVDVFPEPERRGDKLCPAEVSILVLVDVFPELSIIRFLAISQ